MLGTQKINLEIEIGDRKLDPNVIDKCVSNANFTTTHRKYTIVKEKFFSKYNLIEYNSKTCKLFKDLPEEDEYKPHLNIRCECYGSLFLYSAIHKELETLEKTFSRKILIGTCTIKSIGDYCIKNEKLTQFCKSRE